MGYKLDKMFKHIIMAKSPELASSLPDTRKMSNHAFHTLVARYRKVIIKPSAGSGGFGVIQVASIGKGKYEVHYEKTKKTISGQKEAYAFVHSKTKKAPHMIQQRIPLSEIKGRPFDIRVMVQREGKSNWTITGKLAKLAGSGYIVTNIARSKGTVIPLITAIERSNITGTSAKEIQKKMDKVSTKTAQILHAHYPWLHTIGMDIGLDSNGKVWIIEANFAPSISLFLHLKDKSFYKRIQSYSRKHKSK
ncbi:YheC/YheD family protein [Paenibacillus eucommiae]|uniref:Circularly permuted ATP-grasp superfamily protein n=1 Tax=Paenibacillus eucommiae TaxID=1355755 RepID=A0ABS4J6U2_9BACL|nr:YheC/YheD family protein [Paenibacillus eucommiae]MBP1995555.1 putative circularly permuted ATP-grasp superfamily protein [Paenibacillus eucommiae]